MNLRDGFIHVIEEKEFVAALDRKPLRIKVGFDPTSPDLHLGHAVLLRKMRQFQDAGHIIVLIVGNATAAIGDPTGRNSTRPPLSLDQIQENASTYTEQAFRILDRSRTVIRYNASWLYEAKLPTIIKLMSKFTVSQMLQRRDFAQRFEDEQPIHLHELVYPLLQAYDSKWEEVDMELGGTDQLFNLMMGRELMKEMGSVPQIVCTVPLLEGTDGVQKMSKSLGNYIGLTEAPLTVYSKVMSISDVLMRRWQSILFPDAPNEDDPFVQKKALAWKITAMLHSTEIAESAQMSWIDIHSKRQVPTDIPIYSVPAFPLSKLLVHVQIATSNSDGARLVRQSAVEVNGVVITDERFVVPDGATIRAGRKWVKISQSN